MTDQKNDRSSQWLKAQPKPVRFALYGIFGLVFSVAFFLAFGFATMFLWNAVIPEISSLPALTYWHAVALYVLARLLTGLSKGAGGWRTHRKAAVVSDQHYDEWWESEGKAAFLAFKRRADANDFAIKS